MALHPQLIYQAPITVSTYEIDQHKRMTIPALINQMHEAAMQNVLHLKVSVWDLEPYKISWVLMRLRLHIRQLPRLGETITIRTHPAGFEKFFTYRDYRIFNEANEQIAEASSTWLLMDTDARKMSRIPADILAFEMLDQADCLPRIKDRLPALPKRPVPTDPVRQQQNFHVNWHDLDFNKHLSNVNYFKWMLDALPESWLHERQLSQFDIQFRLEASLDDEVQCEWAWESDTEIRHRLLRLSDGKELAAAQTIWGAGL